MNNEEQKRKIYRSIKKDGILINIVVSTTTAYDPITNTETTISITVNTYAVITRYKLDNIDGTRIKMGDKLLLVPALTVDSSNLDLKFENSINYNDNYYKIVNIDTIEPAGIPLMYKVQVRK